MGGIALIPGSGLLEVVNNLPDDIRVLNAAVRRLGRHPYRPTTMVTDRNIDIEYPFQTLLPRACAHVIAARCAE